MYLFIHFFFYIFLSLLSFAIFERNLIDYTVFDEHHLHSFIVILSIFISIFRFTPTCVIEMATKWNQKKRRRKRKIRSFDACCSQSIYFTKIAFNWKLTFITSIRISIHAKKNRNCKSRMIKRSSGHRRKKKVNRTNSGAPKAINWIFIRLTTGVLRTK